MEGVAMSSADLQICDESNNKDCTEEIINLHDEISQQVKSILPKIMRIGELLVEQKQKMQHGQFTQWVTDNLPFSVRTAQNYMKVFLNKEQLKNENVSLLSDAYNILKLPRGQFNEKEDKDEKKYFFTISIFSEEKEVLEIAVDLAKKLYETESNSKAIYQICYEWISWMLEEINKK
jgi:hypothetical protein